MRFFCIIGVTLVGSLAAVALYTLAERKILAGVQRRRGPDASGIGGLLQPIADGLKLIGKELIRPITSSVSIFYWAPCLSLAYGIGLWIVLPWSATDYTVDLDLSLLFIYSMSSISVYGVILAGWSSNSKYTFLGALRSASQLISYEISISLLLLPFVLTNSSMNLVNLFMTERWSFFVLLPNAVLLFVSLLAETNRAPFYLPEAEAEIVAGYNLEYSSTTFAMFFLAEYSNMLWLAHMYVILFLGGAAMPGFGTGVGWLVLKTICLSYIIVTIRASFPRYRFDQLLMLGWGTILPLALGWTLLISVLVFWGR